MPSVPRATAWERRRLPLPREQASRALIAMTRRYAAYQRKWMRRIPGIVVLDADRPAAETAAEILALAAAPAGKPA